MLREPPITQRREELSPIDRSGLGGVDLVSGRERTVGEGVLRVGGLTSKPRDRLGGLADRPESKRTGGLLGALRGVGAERTGAFWTGADLGMLGAERCMLGAERDGPGETGADRAGEFIWATMGAANTPSRRQLRKV